MPINTSLLISAPMLQDYLVDKDTGLPLAAGIVTLYEDNNRSILKNWYEQQGTNPPYSYVPLPNPMTLSAVGTIQDLSGNDVIPFYYPYDENATSPTVQTYYITVQDQNGELQFTRSNFPFVPPGAGTTSEPALINLLINNGFWRNISTATNMAFDPQPLMTNTITINSVALKYVTLAPSQHDGHIMPDINYYKNVTDGTETISFNTFNTDNALDMDVTPELYMDLAVSSAGTSTVRYVQIPLQLHVHSLSGYTQGTFTIQAMSVSGTNRTITVGVFQFLGTGVTSPAVTQTAIVLGTAWEKHVINLPIPTAQGTTLGAGGDDALYIQIGFPVGAAFEMAIALPEFYLGSPPATNSFQTYDVVNAITSSPRTGDTRTSLNTFAPYGWVPANDGTIGTVASAATSRANSDTWPLYNLLWNTVNNTFAPVSTGRGASAYADFAANKTIGLTKALGRALIGLPTSSTFTYDHTTSLLTVADTSLYYVGSPITVSNSGGALPAAFTAGTVYYVIPISSTTLKLASSYANALTTTAVAAGATDGTGTNTISFALAGTFGQATHTQLEVELAAHNHPGSTYAPYTKANTAGAGGAVGVPSDSGSGSLTLTIATDGASQPFNIVQPSTYLNVFLKL